MNELLKNEHILLRALEPEDLETLYKWENDTSLWRVTETLAPYSRYTLKKYIAEAHTGLYEQRQLRLMIEMRSTQKAIGTIDLYDFDPHHRRAGIGILIDKQDRGKGLGAEALSLIADYAFTYLRLHQLYAYIPVGNKPSLALFERCGYVYAGRLSEWLADGENYSDVFIMQYRREIQD